jgi:hypothetical protein
VPGGPDLVEAILVLGVLAGLRISLFPRLGVDLVPRLGVDLGQCGAHLGVT